jgi:hypothetical protein
MPTVRRSHSNFRSELSTIDWLSAELPAWQIQAYRPWSVRPAVVDANALVSDVFYAAVHDGQSALLDLARFGSVRLFTSAHIYGKVYERLPKLALTGAGRDRLDSAIRTWETEYLPRLRFVQVPDHLLSSPRVAAVPDPEDRPIAALAFLLAPTVLFSEDAHLRGFGLAGSDWRPIAVAGRDLAAPQKASVGAVFGAQVVYGVGSGILEWLRAETSRFRVALVVLGVGTAYAIYRLAKIDRVLLKVTIVETLGKLDDATQPIRDRLGAARQLVDRATLVDRQDPSAVSRVAKVLAVAPRPFLMREIREAIDNDGRGAPVRMRAISAALCSSFFLRTRQGRWLLGGWMRPRPRIAI